MNDDNQRQIVRNEETVVAGDADRTVVSQTQSSTGTAATTAPATAAPAVGQSTVQTTTQSSAPSERVVAHNVAERVVDPAAEKAAGVDWVNRLIWFIVGLMAALLLIRFGLLAAGANEAAGFSQLIYGLTGWMVAPFKGIFGSPWTYPGTAGTGVLEWESLLAAAVYLLIGWAITKLADLMLGTNRTTGTVYSETDRQTRV
jgi:hypothetical protein